MIRRVLSPRRRRENADNSIVLKERLADFWAAAEKESEPAGRREDAA
jgi:hypothetical protein